MMIYTDGVHLVSFPYSAAELHSFAQRLGLARHWFQSKNGNHPHYDLTVPRRAMQAVDHGAFFCSTMDIGRLFRAAKTGKEYRPVRLEHGPDNAAVCHQHRRLMARFKRKQR